MRSDSKHSEQCDILEQDDLPAADQQHYSLVYGVNCQALLSTLEFFGVASGALLSDIMHDILEGALPLEVKLMLKVFYTCTCMCTYTMYNDMYKYNVYMHL